MNDRSDIMNKCVMAALVGFAAGVYVGYMKEDELEDFTRQTHKTKRKAIRNMHKAYDTMCDCMDLD